MKKFQMDFIKEGNFDIKSKFIVKPHECDKVASTLSPCVDCLKIMTAYGIRDIYFTEKYENSDYNLVDKIAKQYNIRLHHIV
jgi:deoxycytidylate deaminase